ncbi:TetR family transcriptional regulator [Actinokineospora soli]
MRDEQRERTRQAIFRAAAELFAEHGYERTTIRAVARRAGADPSAVMQHFGSKERLVAAVAAASVDSRSLVDAVAEALARAAVEHVLARFDDPGDGAAAIALLRSSLTHPTAGDILRDDVMAPVQRRVAETIGGADARERAALLNACALGVSIARYLLRDPVLAGMDRDRLADLLTPAMRAIVG